MPDRFDKFTERARRVLTMAQEEAQRFNHNFMGTEHLLLGLVREGDGIAAQVLTSLGVQFPKVRSAVESIIGRGETSIMGEIGLTPRAKKVIELAVDEARRLNHHHIGTEHLLLGLVREGEGIAAGVLASMGVELKPLRARILEVLTSGGADASATFSSGVVPPIVRPMTPDEVALAGTDLGELRQVVPIVQTLTQARTTITAIALERYEHGFVVTWRLEVASVDYPYPLFRFTTVDDRGNAYGAVMHGASGGGDPTRGEWRYAYRFGPALDPAAAALTLDFVPHAPHEARGFAPDGWRFVVALPPLPEN